MYGNNNYHPFLIAKVIENFFLRILEVGVNVYFFGFQKT